MVDHAPHPPPRGAPARRAPPVEPGGLVAGRRARRQRRGGVHRVPHRRCGRSRGLATARCAPRGSPGWRPARCRWRSASTCRWRASATSSRPTCGSSARRSQEHPVAELRELAADLGGAGHRAGAGDGGGAPAHRAGRPRGPRPRRARPHRGHRRPPGAGVAGVVGGVHARRPWCRWWRSSSRRTTAARPSSFAAAVVALLALGWLGAVLGSAKRLRAMARVGRRRRRRHGHHAADRRAHRRRPRLISARLSPRGTNDHR